MRGVDLKVRGSSLKRQLWVLVFLGYVKGNHTRSGCLGRANLLSHQEDEDSACPGLGEECPCLAWDLPIFRFQDGHNENLWGLRWLFRKNRGGGHDCASACAGACEKGSVLVLFK